MENELETNPRYMAIFSEGVVVTRKRDTSIEEFFEPQLFIQEIENQERQQRFDTQAGQANVLKRSVEQSATVTRAELTSTDVEVPVQLKCEWIKSQRRTTIPGVSGEVVIPHIKSSYLGVATTVAATLVENALSRLQILCEALGGVLDKARTRESVLRARVRNLNIDEISHFSKSGFYEIYLLYIVLSDMCLRSDDALLDQLQVQNAILREGEEGMFLPTGSGDDSIESRRKSMVPIDAIASAPQITYNLNFRQLCDLISWIYCDRRHVRLRAKINLLSGARDFRTEVCGNPMMVLRQTIGEHHLTTPDVFYLFFREDSQGIFRCARCNAIVTIQVGPSVRHLECGLSEELVKDFPGFQITSESRLRPVPVRYVKPGIAAYVRKVQQMKLTSTTQPVVAETSGNVTCFIEGEGGVYRKAFQHGTRPVTLTHLPDR